MTLSIRIDRYFIGWVALHSHQNVLSFWQANGECISCRAKRKKNMVAGHLQEKNGYFYAIFSYKDQATSTKPSGFPRGIP